MAVVPTGASGDQAPRSRSSTLLPDMSAAEQGDRAEIRINQVGEIALVFLLYQKGRLEVFRPGPSYRRSPCGTRTTSEMTRRCSRIRSAATAFMTAAREACRELRCMVEAINADRAARPFLIARHSATAGSGNELVGILLSPSRPVRRSRDAR